MPRTVVLAHQPADFDKLARRLHRETCTGGPLRAHPDSQRRPDNNENVKVGERPAMNLQTEYHKMDSISGVLRPIWSATPPEPELTSCKA
jgi:hypothetical protein